MNETGLKRASLRAIRKLNLPTIFFYAPQESSRSGIPDWIMVINGAFGAIEFKSPSRKTKPTPIQEFTHKKIKEAGGKVAVCRTVAEVIAFVKSFYPIQTKQGE